ncbi:MAG: hypothetical protein C4320_08400, partial [Armatimonadota bacterium]
MTRPDGRVFPTTATAKEVVAILRRYLDEAGVELRTNSPVRGLVLRGNRVVGVRSEVAEVSGIRSMAGGFGAKALLRERAVIADQAAAFSGELRARAVILATGGSSYPNAGTTGDGWPWAREVGHSVVKVRAALAPLYIELEGDGILSPDLSGIALQDVEIRARAGGKTVARWRGDLLMTH